MINQDLAKKMLVKKTFKQVTGAGKGIFGLIEPSYKRYIASSKHKVVPQKLITYYQPTEEGTGTGFGEYGIYACILNDQGEKELEQIKMELEETGLLNNISNIRYESQDVCGCCLIDGFNDGEIEEGEQMIRQHSTDNVYVYVLTNDDGEKLKTLNTAVACIHPKYGRTVYSCNFNL